MQVPVQTPHGLTAQPAPNRSRFLGLYQLEVDHWARGYLYKDTSDPTKPPHVLILAVRQVRRLQELACRALGLLVWQSDDRYLVRLPVVVEIWRLREEVPDQKMQDQGHHGTDMELLVPVPELHLLPELVLRVDIRSLEGMIVTERLFIAHVFLFSVVLEI